MTDERHFRKYAVDLLVAGRFKFVREMCRFKYIQCDGGFWYSVIAVLLVGALLAMPWQAAASAEASHSLMVADTLDVHDDHELTEHEHFGANAGNVESEDSQDSQEVPCCADTCVVCSGLETDQPDIHAPDWSESGVADSYLALRAGLTPELLPQPPKFA